MNKEQMVTELKNGACVVSFTKVDGESRVMTCTLDMGNVPTEYHPKGTKKTTSPDTVSVFDVESEDWRSFRVTNVTSFVNSIGAELND